MKTIIVLLSIAIIGVITGWNLNNKYKNSINND